MTATPAQTSVSLLASATTRPSRIAANVGARPTAPTIPETTRSAGRLAASSIASSPAAISICRPATPAFRSGYPAGSAIAANFAPSAIAERASAAPSRPPTTASTAKRSGAAAITCVQDRPIEPVAPSNTSRFGRAEPGAPAAFTWSPLKQSFRDPGPRRTHSGQDRGDGGRRDEPVEPIHQAAVARNESAGILDAGAPFHRGFEEISELGNNRDEES